MLSRSADPVERGELNKVAKGLAPNIKRWVGGRFASCRLPIPPQYSFDPITPNDHNSCAVEYHLIQDENSRSAIRDSRRIKFTETCGFLHIDNGEQFTRHPQLVIAGYGAWRRLSSSSLGLDRNSGTDHLFDPSADLTNAEELLLRADYAAARSEAGSASVIPMIDRIESVLLKILPDVTKIWVAGMSLLGDDIGVMFETPYGSVLLQQLGYGYQSLISWVVDFAARLFQAYPNSPDPLAEPAVCLIDEIDLHLHPSWQRKVLKYLSDRFPKTQFIATAHSPLIVQAAAEVNANIAVLRREGDHVVISNNPIDVHGWRADQILASELFDEQPLRSPEVQKQMDERTKLLSKRRLTKADKARLEVLNKVAEALPVGTHAKHGVAAQLKAAADLLEQMTSEQP